MALWIRVDGERQSADNPESECEDAVDVPVASTATGREGRGRPTRRPHPSRGPGLPRRELSTASTAPMTMTRPHSMDVAPTTRAFPGTPTCAGNHPIEDVSPFRGVLWCHAPAGTSV